MIPAFTPPGQIRWADLRERDEVGWGGELDVDGELLLDPRQGSQDVVLLGLEPDVDVQGRGAPAKQDGRRSARQEAVALAGCSLAECLHEAANSRFVGQFTHAVRRTSPRPARS